MPDTIAPRRNLWTWIPTLYTAEGLPYAVAMSVSVILYKKLGISNTDIALYTSWLYLPWVVKPLWSPVINLVGTRRAWIWSMQLAVGISLAGVALSIPVANFFPWTLAFFWLIAFCSATHDIAADGFYMLGANENEQALFVGVRNTFYRIAMITGQGLMVMLAGAVHQQTRNLALAWTSAIGCLAFVMLSFGAYHRFALPLAPADRPGDIQNITAFLRQFFQIFAQFFRKRRIVAILLFLLLYRFGEAQLVKMVPPFLLDSHEKGGLELSETQVGFVYGTVGTLFLLVGGILGGIAASRHGLKRWLWPMVLAMHLPDAVFLFLAFAQPTHLAPIAGCVAVEQFGYGFGFAGYMVYMLHIARGEHQTAHYAICTGFMALGMMIPGMWSGWLEERLGYPHFFAWVLLATLPSYLVVLLIPLDRRFGKSERPPQASQDPSGSTGD